MEKQTERTGKKHHMLHLTLIRSQFEQAKMNGNLFRANVLFLFQSHTSG